MTDSELMQQALEALELLSKAQTETALDYADNAITALRLRLAQPEQEPVAWANINKHGDITHTNNKRMPWSKTPLYITPPAQPAKQEPVAWFGLEPSDMPDGDNPMYDHDFFLKGMAWADAILRKKNTTPPAAQRQWVGLTDEEIIDVIHPLVMADMPDEATDYEIARAIEAKLKERNHG